MISTNKLQDQDLLNLFLEMIDDEIENEIFKIVFYDSDEETRIDNLISFLESRNDQN